MNSRREIRPDFAVSRGFDAIAQAYRTTDLRGRASELRDFIGWIRPQPNERALDVASGPATIAYPLSRRVKVVFALDVSHAMLREASRLRALAPNLFLVSGSVERLPFAPHRFDLLACGYAFAVFRDPEAMLREAARVLTPSGRIALMDVVAPEDPVQRRRLNALEAMRGDFYTCIRARSEWLKLFRGAGFKLVASQFRQQRQRVADWLRLSPAAADPRRSRELCRVLLDSIRGDKAGVPVRRNGMDFELRHQTAWFLLRREPKGKLTEA